MMCICKHCFLPMLLVFTMKCCTKMPCPLPHNHYCCLLSSPVCLPHLLICTCLISSPIVCPPSYFWYMLHFFVTPFWIVCVHIFAFCNIIYWHVPCVPHWRNRALIHCSCANALYPAQAIQRDIGNLTCSSIYLRFKYFSWMLLWATENVVAGHMRPVVGPHWYKEYDTCHMYYIFIFRVRSSFRSTSPGSEVPCCQQQLECERKTLELLWDRCLKILSQLTSDSVLASPSVLSSVKVINKQVSSAKIFYFQAW